MTNDGPTRFIQKRAFTLFELLLVLVLMVIMVAAGGPAMMRSLKGHRLTVSASQIQTEFHRARVEAMETGRIRMFRYQENTGNYAVAPFIRGGDALENNLAGTSDSIGGNQLILDSAETETHQGTLEELVVFSAAQVDADGRTLTLEDEGAELSLSGWSSPILFYPDGTSSNAQVYMTGEDGSQTSVRLRGITGIARVVKPEHADQQP